MLCSGKTTNDISDFDKCLIRFVDEGLTSCLSIAVSKNNELIYDLTYGYASPEKRDNSAVTPDMLFNVASVSKPFTGAVIVKLVEFGLISINDTVKKHIGEFLYDDVTIYHLLTHTSGIDSSTGLDIPLPVKSADVPGFMQSLYKIDKRVNKPNEKFNYFTLGYCILRDLAERVTGMTFRELVQDYIFDPVGMKNSHYDPDDFKGEKYVHIWDDNLKMLIDVPPHPIMGDRGLFTTAKDLVKFGNMMINCGMASETCVFKKPSVDFMLREITGGRFMKTPVFTMKDSSDNYRIKTPQDSQELFGDLNSPCTVGHAGVSGCMFFIDPVYKVTAAVLTNSPKLHEDWKNYKKICNIIMTM